MTGETNLSMLLQSMQPTLYAGEYVFCTLNTSDARISNGTLLNTLAAIGLFQEAEGLTVILPRQQADAASLPYTGVFRLITLAVHSSLEAVGFMAIITTLLAKHQISVNPISAYYHDHLFVPLAQAEQAIQLLQSLAQSFQARNSETW
jgi:hypothetical protein